jgi:hypothetical protein
MHRTREYSEKYEDQTKNKIASSNRLHICLPHGINRYSLVQVKHSGTTSEGLPCYFLDPAFYRSQISTGSKKEHETRLSVQ